MGPMASIRCGGGIVLEDDRRVWLAAEPGDEVDEARRFPGAPVVVGPREATLAQVDRARREARRLVAVGGPLVAAAGVELTAKGFRTARLEGSTESRRDAVLAAVEVLGSKGLHRIGDTASVLVALFGVRATKRVGTAALDALAAGQPSSLRLAVAASDLLGPEQLETVLALRSPLGIEPVPKGDALVLGGHLASILGPYTSRRRVDLLLSLWDDVVGWQLSAIARGRARRRQASAPAVGRWYQKLRQVDAAWWEARAARELGGPPDAMALATWRPGRDVWLNAMVRAFHECAAATVLLRTALAAEDQPSDEAVLAHFDALDHSGRSGDQEGPAARRAALLASTVALGSAPDAPSGTDRLGGRDLGRLLATQLRGTSVLAHATLLAATDLAVAIQRQPVAAGAQPLSSPALAEWRAVAGYGPARPPNSWAYQFLSLSPVLPLAHRLETDDPVAAATAEMLDDGLWIADLADALAAWYGHQQADVYALDCIVVDPAEPVADGDVRVPLLDSVPLAAAGAAQLRAMGAAPPSRPKAWSALVAALVTAAENLGLDEPFRVAPGVAATDRAPLPGTHLTIEVGRTPRQLAEWGNYMGNCIAEYSDEAGPRFALVALRDPTGTLVANISLGRGTRRWVVSEALARFNEELAPDLRSCIGTWVDQIPVATAAPGTRTATRPRRASPGGRRPPARDRLARTAARLGDELAALAGSEEMARMATALAPIARELGWAAGSGHGDRGHGGRDGADDGWLAPFVAIARPRASGPLAAATGRALGSGCPLAELWQATSTRPLAAAIERLPEPEVDIRRLVDTTIPAALRLGLRDPRVRAARTVDLAARRVRVALAELLVAADPVLDRAAVDRPHVGFVTAAVLILTARDSRVVQPVDWVPVALDGALPGRPRSSVRDADGPWVTARGAALEMDSTATRLDHVMADAPGRHLLVPAAWTASAGWTGLWARAHRATRSLVTS